MRLLTPEFLSNYPDMPEHMNELGAFVFYRTYSRFLPELGRRETWKEAVARAVDYNVGITLDQFEQNEYKAPREQIKLEAEKLFDNIFHLRQFLSGRTHWVGGAEGGVAEKFPLANFNCSFLNILFLNEEQNDLGDLFYLLLVGTGVGFKNTLDMAKLLPPIRTSFNLIHAPYEPVPKEQRLEHTKVTYLDNGFAKIYVGDSKEGWVEALKEFFNIVVSPKNAHIHTIKFSYNSVRPNGERLITFGGSASGHEPLKEMFDGFQRVIRGEMDKYIHPPEFSHEDEYANVWVRLRPIHILDMGNLIGFNVVVGGVRRTAEIFLMSADDWESILAKYGINGLWNVEHHNKVIAKLDELGQHEWAEKLRAMDVMDADVRPLHHRRMSNNSIAFETKPSEEMLELVFLIMQGEGEPGFINLEEARRRRPNAEGLNPCAEILLDSYGVCNLTTINADAFVHVADGVPVLDYSGLMEAQALSVRAGMRMTCVDLELPHWDKVQKRDRLIGTSLTGWKDAMGKLGYDEEQEKNLLHVLAEVSHVTAMRYAMTLRIPVPLLDTTVKPEGTLSQVAGGVSSGLHEAHAPYYIRRIRINANDPLAKVAMSLGWTVNPEVGQDWLNARTLVIDFPVKSGAVKTKDDVSVKEQFDTYFNFQDVYTAHNSSNTISVRPDEWDTARQIVWDNWDNFVGVSFLAHDGGSYQLAPYEAITEEQYHELKASMKPFDPSLLKRWEVTGVSELTDESCSDGACAPR